VQKSINAPCMVTVVSPVRWHHPLWITKLQGGTRWWWRYWIWNIYGGPHLWKAHWIDCATWLDTVSCLAFSYRWKPGRKMRRNKKAQTFPGLAQWTRSHAQGMKTSYDGLYRNMKRMSTSTQSCRNRKGRHFAMKRKISLLTHSVSKHAQVASSLC
jgi:hypothetical protein